MGEREKVIPMSEAEKTLMQLKTLNWKNFLSYYYQYKKVNEIAGEL